MIDSLLSVFLLTGALVEATRRKPAVLEGAVAGLPDGVVELQNQAGAVATAKLIDGGFRMEIEVGFPNDYYLVFENGHRVPVVIENEFLSVEIDFRNAPAAVEITQSKLKKPIAVPANADGW